MLATIACLCLAFLGMQPGDEESALRQRLDRFDAKTALIEDLTADFEQHKHSILLRSPIISTGGVRVKGDVVRWDTQTPIESVIRVDERDARIYYPDQRLVEIYELGADLRFLAGSPVPRLSALRERFDIAETDGDGLEKGVVDRDGAVVVALSPRDDRLAERIDRIRLVLDENSGVMRLFELIDPNGDRSVTVFTDIRINTGVKDADVALETPKDVRISRPFGGGNGDASSDEGGSEDG